VTFPEATTVRNYIRDLVKDRGISFVAGKDLPRKTGDVLIESHLRDALVRLNPEITEDPARAGEVLYELRAILHSARTTPHPVVANEAFAAWLTGQRSRPFGPGGAHTTVHLIDLDHPESNHWVISTEVTYLSGSVERRFDLVLWCNGIPLVVIETKTAVATKSWFDGAKQIHENYEASVPAFFVPNVFTVATEGKDLRYGSVGMAIELWGPWRDDSPDADPAPIGLAAVRQAVEGLLTPAAVIDFLHFFTLFTTDKQHRKIKQIARYQQFQGTNRIVDRVITGQTRQGLIWHFQGSGKSLLMLFTVQKLRATPSLQSPTVIIVVDRIDLDAQITGTFTASGVANLETAGSRQELQRLLARGSRKVIITTVHKFAESPGVLDTRDNIIVLVDEAHRTQEGDLGRAMRDALPNAFLFGLTGTPINSREHNTFKWFGSESDPGHYLSRYTFQDSIRDGATLPLVFEPRISRIHLDETAIDIGFDQLADEYGLSKDERTSLSQQASSLASLIKAPDRVRQIAADVARHFREKVDPLGLKAQLVVYDKATCIAYKAELDKHLDPAASTVVVSRDNGPQRWPEEYTPDREQLERLTARFNDPSDPLKIIIVTAKLLTGFDAPILYAQYLDKPLRDHTLLQAITRTNRVFPPNKQHGLIVDYLGIFDDVGRALEFDDKSIQQVIENIANLRDQMEPAMATALAVFPGVDRTVGGWQGLTAAQAALVPEDTRDAFGAAYSVVSQLWEALSPDPILTPYETDYRWLTDVYRSVHPSDAASHLLWHVLGPKTLALISQNVTVEVPRKGMDSILLDAQVIEDIMSGKERDVDPKAVEQFITARILKHRGNPAFIELSKRLTALRERYDNAQQASFEFLKELFQLAQDTVAAEKAAAGQIAEDRVGYDPTPLPREEQGKAALTERFESLRRSDTPIIVANVVNDVDKVVRLVRFDGWQATHEGDRTVRQALRKTLYVTYKIHDDDVFERAVDYVREYY